MTHRAHRSIRSGVTLAVVAAFTLGVAGAGATPITVGAIYPTGGTHGRGGIDEYRGVQLAAEHVNARGGVAGRPVRIRLEPADRAEQAPGAVRALAAEGIPVILGSYGSTISAPAADAAERAGVVFWETGAVGTLSMAASQGRFVFRFPPTGQTLGRSAVRFARVRAIPLAGHDPEAVRYGVTFVDDAYGRSVADGALAALADAGIEPAGVYPYDMRNVSFPALIRRMRADRIDVLFVSSYLADGIEIRRQTVAQHLDLVASVGTSSSYCMHEFGEALGDDAVGLFASDKPDGHVLDATRLTPEAGTALIWARDTFRQRFNHEMTAAALTGFAGALALFEHVLPNADATTATEIAAAARRVQVPVGALPNGSGLSFPDAGSAHATDNLRATSVIWEWVAPGVRAVVSPPEFATRRPVALPIS
jgi:branched-chain amino acid transport system substrate-binding protein